MLAVFLASAPNWLIIGLSALVNAGLGLVVAGFVHRLYPVALRGDVMKHADTVHASIVGFAVFILALGISDARGNLEQAQTVVDQEAFRIARFDRQLMIYDAAATAAIRADLLAYAKSIVEAGWPQLALARREGSPVTIGLIDRLEQQIYRLEAHGPLQESMRPRLVDGLAGLEEQREVRLEKSTTSMSALFWTMIFLFMFLAMLLSGRYPPSLQRRFFVASHLAALGLAIGMLVVLDAPFRGETSVSPQPLLRSIAGLSAAQGR